MRKFIIVAALASLSSGAAFAQVRDGSRSDAVYFTNEHSKTPFTGQAFTGDAGLAGRSGSRSDAIYMLNTFPSITNQEAKATHDLYVRNLHDSGLDRYGHMTEAR